MTILAKFLDSISLKVPQKPNFTLEVLSVNFGRSGFIKSTPEAGLPDVSWYKIPKRNKYTKITTKYTKCQ
jgi:hypothetical protein